MNKRSAAAPTPNSRHSQSRPSKLTQTTVFRLALTYAGLYALVTALVLGTVYEFTAINIHKQINADIKAEVESLTALYRAQGKAALRQAVARRSTLLSEGLSRIPETGRRYYLLLAPNGRRLAGSVAMWPAQARGATTWVTYTISARAAARARMTKPEDFDADESLRVHGLAVRLPGKYRLLVVETLDEASELSRYIMISLLLAVGLLVGFGLAGGIWMGRHVLARLEAVRFAATDIMAGDLTRRIPVPASRRDEFSELAATLNAMLTRIEELMIGLRQVTDNVAHDLRSPLNRLRGRLDVTLRRTREPQEYRRAMERAVADADELLHTFNAMLHLAELEAGVRRKQCQHVALGSLCEDVVSMYEPLAERKRIELTSQITPVRVTGDSRLLAQAVGNLLDNAIKYTPSGGALRLSLRRDEHSGELTVADSGPGIPADECERVFERFVRLDASRSEAGNGLGLSLVRAVVRLHGGGIQLSDNRPGLRVNVRLPLSRR